MSDLTPGPQSSVELSSTRVFLRPIANPYALGFMGMAVSTLILSGVQLHWIPVSQSKQAAVLIMAFGPVLLLISSVFGFLARDPVAATSMGIQAPSWLCIGLSLLLSSPTSHSEPLGLLLFVAAAGMIFSANTAAVAKLVPALVLGLAGIRFILTGIYEVGVGSTWAQVGGWVGVALCAAGAYAALSLEMEDAYHQTVLPTLRKGKGRQALHPHLSDQVQEVAAEAGVRSQL